MNESEFAGRVAALGGQLYVVGGWVRDRLIGRPSEDKDYVVCGLNAQTLEREFQVRSVGRQFPVYLLEVGGRLSEVALARTERKAGTGYRGFEARFSPDTTIEEDLYRRDTRMNSMAVRLPGGGARREDKAAAEQGGQAAPPEDGQQHNRPAGDEQVAPEQGGEPRPPPHALSHL